MEQQHTIGKLSLQVKLSSQEDVFTLQGRLSNACTSVLAPLLAELLDTWTDPSELLQIDKLEIDLGICKLEELEKLLPELIIAQLSKQYTGIRHEVYLEPGMERITLEQGYFNSWLHFLSSGVLPHTSVKWTREEWEAGVLATLSSESSACRSCSQLFTDHPVAVKRLLLQFSPSFVHNWLLAYSGSTYQQTLQLLTEWETFCYHPQLSSVINSSGIQHLVSLPALSADKKEFHFALMEWLIREFVLPARQPDIPFLLGNVIRLLPHASVKYWLYILQETPAAVMDSVPVLKTAASVLISQYHDELVVFKKDILLKSGKQDIIDRKEDIAAGKEKRIVDKEEVSNDEVIIEKKNVKLDDEELISENKIVKDIVDEENVNDEEIFSDNVLLSSTSSSSSSSLEEESPPDATLYINNAGLILLNPYIGILFEALGIKDLKDDNMLSKAVQVLGYLASGDDALPEYELVLPKILCGVLPARPVKKMEPLTVKEKQEADELLEAVISHWSALGSTTPDGLRGNFLMREGKLEWKEEEWQLYVTQQAYDMLLNRLPWGFSVVSFSWMSWLIKTVWI